MHAMMLAHDVDLKTASLQFSYVCGTTLTECFALLGFLLRQIYIKLCNRGAGGTRRKYGKRQKIEHSTV